MSDQADLFSVAGRVACVTGASSGIGRALAEVLATAGASVVGLARRAEALEAWRSGTCGLTAAIPADLSDPDIMVEISGRISEPFGPPDILVNAAGVNMRQAADDVTPEAWQMTLNLNLSTPFFLAKELVPAMRDRGWGRIINFASLQTTRAFPGGIAYGASKGGIGQLTRAMASPPMHWPRDFSRPN